MSEPAGTPAGEPRRSGRKRWLSAARLHIPLVIIVPGCLGAGWFELTRARAGNQLSWTYVFEWPAIGAFCVYIWWRLRREEAREAAGLPARDAAPADAATTAADDGSDPQLTAWNDYVRRLHAADPPGEPPAR